jgi:integrase
MAVRELNRLSAREVASAKDGWHADGGGLYLRVQDDGKRRRWVFRFVLKGKATEIGLGSGAKGAVTLAGARAERIKLADKVKTGLNPLAERRRNQTAEASRKTFAEVAKAYIEREASGWSDSHFRAWKRSLLGDNAATKPLSPLYVDEIGIADVRRAVQPLVDKGWKDTARRTQNRIEKTLDYAVEQGWRPEDRRSSWSSVAGKRSKREKQKHHRALHWSELPVVVERVRASDSMGARALLFMILTAARVSEACEARWSEISFDKAVWSIPPERMKAGVIHDVPLSRQALAILAELKTHRTKSQFVFPGYDARYGNTSTKAQPRAIGRMAVWMLCGRATEGKATPHGFRSTFRDWCGESGKPREHAERAIAHKFGSANEASYARSTLLELRRPLMQEWADCACGDGDRADSNVVPLRAAV